MRAAFHVYFCVPVLWIGKAVDRVPPGEGCCSWGFHLSGRTRAFRVFWKQTLDGVRASLPHRQQARQVLVLYFVSSFCRIPL